MSERPDLPEPGCLFDGRFGHDFTLARVVSLAADHGLALADEDRGRTSRVLGASFSESELTEDEWEPFVDLGLSAEEHLNSIAPEGHHFGFSEGDFFLMPDEWWEEE